MTDAGHHHSPLAQFEVYPLVPLKIAGVNVSFTNSSLWMVIAVGVIAFLLFQGIRRRQLVPGRWQAFNEMLMEFVGGIVKENAGQEAMKFFPLIFTVFLFILFANLLGMLPYAFTVTSHVIVTFAMAVMLFLGVTLVGFALHGTHFLALFLPHGIPKVMAPFMFVIELISYFARPISLGLRLAINMMVGHTLMKVVAGFVFALGVWGAFPVAFLVMFTGFEICIAILQAYIFTILICVYLNDAIHLH